LKECEKWGTGTTTDMPNFFSAFSYDVFRPLVTLLIPGAIAISTWFIRLLWHFGDLRKLVSSKHAETGFVLFFAITLAGLICEDLGAHVETRFDTKVNAHDQKHLDNWYAYLRTAFVVSPIGRRYIGTLVLRLKFELGTGFGALSAGLGMFWLWYLGLRCSLLISGEFVCILLAFYVFFEGWSTHNSLAINRENLLDEIRIVPPPEPNAGKAKVQ
jgi:hypothetical protein